MCCVVEGCGPGVTLVDAAGLTARWACGCRRCVGCHRRRAGRSCVPGCRADGCRHIGAGLSLLRTGVTIGDYSGWCGIGRQPRRGDLGASVLVRAGCGEGECGGARLMGSEKSPIVTRRWCVGLGGLIENVLSRRGLRSPTELSGGASVICGNAQSSARIAVPVCGWGAPPDAVGTIRHPVAARVLREASGSRCVRGGSPCRRSLSTLGMDCGSPRLSQSDSRLYAVKLTEPDSITILSAYDST